MDKEKIGTLFLASPEIYLVIGILLASSLFFLTIYFGLRKIHTYLFFSSYTSFCAISLFFLSRNQTIIFLILFVIACISLLYFFAAYFDIEKSKMLTAFSFLMIGFTFVSLEVFGRNNETIVLLIAWLIFSITLMSSSWISLRSIKNKKYGSKLFFFTTFLIFILNFFFLSNSLLFSNSFLISNISIASSLLIIVVSFTVLRDIQIQNDLLNSFKLKAILLENEMLKKSIQPHYLINTLTVLSEWIEEQPSLAVKQIDLLSKEFRYITKVAAEKLIPINDEIKICHVHINMFNAKQTKNFVLKTNNINTNTYIPPMIFHTLIENGLTHSIADEGSFVIEQKESEKEISFCIVAEPLSEQESYEEGLGIKYIKSRLDHAFLDNWQMTSIAKDNSWETLITIEK